MRAWTQSEDFIHTLDQFPRIESTNPLVIETFLSVHASLEASLNAQGRRERQLLIEHQGAR